MSDMTIVNPRGLGVDVDDTLADTAVHCAMKIASEYPETLMGEKVDTLIAKYLQPGVVPNWQNSEIQERIAEHLNNHDFLESVPAIADSVMMLGKIHAEVVPVSFYITSRTLQHKDVTTRWLMEKGFPEAPVMTRAEHEIQVDWKMVILERFYPTTFGLIEDNGEMVLKSKTQYPGKVFLFDRYRNYSNKNVENDRIVIAHDWKGLGQLVGV